MLSGSRIFWISCLETLECVGFGVRPRSNYGFRGAMTISTYVSHIVFDLISSCFEVSAMFAAYTTCMVGIEHLRGQFLSLPKVLMKISDFVYSTKFILVRCKRIYLYDGSKCVFMGRLTCSAAPIDERM